MREAYARGWREAIATLQAKAPDSSTNIAPPGAPNGAATTERSRGRPSKSVDLVREAIFAQPGLKGVEIVRSLAGSGTPVLERTVRTCLRRLYQKRVVWQRKSRWYPRPKEAENLNEEVPGTPPH